MNDEFYIGYLDRSPPGLARHTRRVVCVLFLVVVALAAIVAGSQSPASPGRFEFGVRRTFEGVLRERPVPTLRHLGADGAVTTYLLVGAGKHGLPSFARGYDGHRVRFEGSLVETGSRVMIEMNAPGSFQDLGAIPADSGDIRVTTVGEVVLTGELVDTKCHYGVMRPDSGKVHRACAIRCLSGGVPPGLLLRDGLGHTTLVLLSGPGGTDLRFDPRWAARRIRVKGVLTFRDGDAYLAAGHLERID